MLTIIQSKIFCLPASPKKKKKLKFKIYKTVILLLVLHGCEKNSVLRKILGPKREEDRSWRKLHNDKFHSPYSSPNIVRMIISRRMRCEGHVALLREGKVFTGFWLGGPKGRDHWEDQGVGGKTTLNGP
jgi:hypothetical protein